MVVDMRGGSGSGGGGRCYARCAGAGWRCPGAAAGRRSAAGTPPPRGSPPPRWPAGTWRCGSPRRKAAERCCRPSVCSRVEEAAAAAVVAERWRKTRRDKRGLLVWSGRVVSRPEGLPVLAQKDIQLELLPGRPSQGLGKPIIRARPEIFLDGALPSYRLSIYLIYLN
jgi:hypothetical protein